MSQFFSQVSTAWPVYFRTYSRTIDDKREAWEETVDRNVGGLAKLGKLTADEVELIRSQQMEGFALPSGRWLWVGGTEWIEQPENFSGAYNCTSTNLIDWEAFALMMDLAMMGCGTGAIIEPHFIDNLPRICNVIDVVAVIEPGQIAAGQRQEKTELVIPDAGDGHPEAYTLVVGDSRQGWVGALAAMLDLSSAALPTTRVALTVDLSNVRPPGERLKGFGGVANPVRLPDLFERVPAILAGAIDRQLTSVECCLIIDEAAAVVVAGNIRRSAGMRQFASWDEEAAVAKDNLWQQDSEGGWHIDPERDALRMANHTRVFHSKPSFEEVEAAVAKQFRSGEGAIQFAPEAIARANRDIIQTDYDRKMFIAAYGDNGGDASLIMYFGDKYGVEIGTDEADHRLNRYGLNPCGEILGNDFHCNLAEIHLNRIDPDDEEAQRLAFTAGAISVAALLHHEFVEDRYALSREYDPIVGVSFTGLFDFFVKAFGPQWLKWWAQGRPPCTVDGLRFLALERQYLSRWSGIVHGVVEEYCRRHGLKVPNRCTTVQPAGTKSLLTGASSGWHPPKAARFIRRITFRRDDPVALACLDFGYSVVPSQSDKDQDGRLLDDPFDPRCTEWLVELPVEVPWANVPGADSVEIHKFSALAQFDFYMQVQKHYTKHNTSATIEVRESEIEELAGAIWCAIEDDEGYISAALLARFDDAETFPRMPFEPIDRERFVREQQAVEQRRASRPFGTADFAAALQRIDALRTGAAPDQQGPAGCDSDKCLLPLKAPA